MSNSISNVVVNFAQDDEVVLDDLTFGVIKTGSCLIVLSGEENNMLFEKTLRHQRVKVFNKCITDLDDGILESYVLKDGAIFKRDWIKGKLVPMEDVFPIR